MEEKRAEEPDGGLALTRVEDGADPIRQGSFDVTDYVRELYLNSEDQKKAERKKLRLLRACVALLSVATAFVLLAGLLIVPKLVKAVTLANQTLTALQQVDIESIAGDLESLTKQASDTFETVGTTAEVLNALDMESLNATIAELKSGVESFSKLDVETLNTAISNLNATVAPLAALFGKK